MQIAMLQYLHTLLDAFLQLLFERDADCPLHPIFCKYLPNTFVYPFTATLCNSFHLTFAHCNHMQNACIFCNIYKNFTNWTEPGVLLVSVVRFLWPGFYTWNQSLKTSNYFGGSFFTAINSFTTNTKIKSLTGIGRHLMGSHSNIHHTPSSIQFYLFK